MLIGLNGLAGAGKSEVAHALREIAGFKRLAFADPLKDMLKAVGFTDAQLYGDAKETLIDDLGRTPRQVMQTLGTEWGRDLVHPELWVKLWARRAAEMTVCALNIVADDVRFPNEVAEIHARGGQVWRIERPGLIQGGHVSENNVLAVDATISNDSDLHSLRQRVARQIGLLG